MYERNRNVLRVIFKFFAGVARISGRSILFIFVAVKPFFIPLRPHSTWSAGRIQIVLINFGFIDFVKHFTTGGVVVPVIGTVNPICWFYAERWFTRKRWLGRQPERELPPEMPAFIVENPSQSSSRIQQNARKCLISCYSSRSRKVLLSINYRQKCLPYVLSARPDRFILFRFHYIFVDTSIAVICWFR